MNPIQITPTVHTQVSVSSSTLWWQLTTPSHKWVHSCPLISGARKLKHNDVDADILYFTLRAVDVACGVWITWLSKKKNKKHILNKVERSKILWGHTHKKTPVCVTSCCSLRNLVFGSTLAACDDSSSPSHSSGIIHCLSTNTELNWSCIIHQPPVHYNPGIYSKGCCSVKQTIYRPVLNIINHHGNCVSIRKRRGTYALETYDWSLFFFPKSAYVWLHLLQWHISHLWNDHFVLLCLTQDTVKRKRMFHTFVWSWWQKGSSWQLHISCLKRGHDCQREVTAGGCVPYKWVHSRQFSSDVAEDRQRLLCNREERSVFLCRVDRLFISSSSMC